MLVTFGERLPDTIRGFDELLRQIYGATCCEWGCRGGDHQIEWLAGRVVNQANGAYRLMRDGLYDESLMLTRGIGELTNLFWLFRDPDEFDKWKTLTRGQRMSEFGPAKVRRRLSESLESGAPINDERYRLLCEIGTHPVPAFRPGHYNLDSRAVLGHIMQPVGVLVATSELTYTVGMAAAVLPEFLELSDERARTMIETASNLIRSIGSINVTNYEELARGSVSAARAQFTE